MHERDSKKSELILEAAARLLRQKSFKDLSMEELAEEAGVAKGTLYLYFRSKGDIYLPLLLQKLNAFAKLVTEVGEAIPGIVPEEIETGLQEHFFPLLEGLKKKLASIPADEITFMKDNSFRGILA